MSSLDSWYTVLGGESCKQTDTDLFTYLRVVYIKVWQALTGAQLLPCESAVQCGMRLPFRFAFKQCQNYCEPHDS